MDVFHESCTLSNPFRESTCYKHPPDPSCTDLYLCNSLSSFGNSTVVETGLYHFHRMTVTTAITPFQRSLLKVRHFKDYSNYDYNIFFAIIYLMNNQNQILKLQAFINLSLFA